MSTRAIDPSTLKFAKSLVRIKARQLLRVIRDAATGRVPRLDRVHPKRMTGDQDWPQTATEPTIDGGAAHHGAAGLMAFLCHPSPVFVEIAQNRSVAQIVVGQAHTSFVIKVVHDRLVWGRAPAQCLPGASVIRSCETRKVQKSAARQCALYKSTIPVIARRQTAQKPTSSLVNMMQSACGR